MSEPSKDLPGVRLLEPRAVVAADRLSQRMSERASPMLRTLASGASGFAGRMFDQWFGRAAARPAMGSAQRGPQAFEFPVPWYEPHRAAWPVGGIELRMPAESVPPARALRAPIATPLVAAQDFDAAERELVRLDAAARSGAPLAAPASGPLTADAVASASQQPVPSSPVAATALLSSITPASATPTTLVAATPPHSTRTDAISGAATPTVVPSEGHEVGSASLTAALERGAPPALAGYSSATSDAARQEPTALALVRAYRVAPPVSAPSQSASLGAATTGRPARGATSAAPRLGLVARLTERLLATDAGLRLVYGSAAPFDPAGAPSGARPQRAAWAGEPVLVEREATERSASRGPGGATRAQGSAPARPALPASSRAVSYPSVLPVLRASGPSAEPFSAAEGTVRVAPSPTSIALSPAMPAALAMGWPRLQRFVERLAGPTTLEQAGVLDARISTPRPVAHFARELVVQQGAPPIMRVPQAALALPIRASTPAAVPAGATASMRPPGPVWPATLLGELGQITVQRASESHQHTQQPAQSGGRPGRLAQRAELLATLAEQRVVRELGLPAERANARSVRWSADAFTVLELASDARVASIAAGRPSPALSSRLAASAGPAYTDIARQADATRAAGVDPAASADPRVEIRAAGPPRHGLPTREPLLSIAASRFAPASDEAQHRARPTPSSIGALLAFADAQLGPRLLGAASPLPVRGPQPVYLRAGDEAPRAPAASPAAATTNRGLAGTFSPWLGASPFVAPTQALPEMSREANRAAPPRTLLRAGTDGLVGPAELSIAQSGRRSEQLAGELGIRVGSLASEFLVDGGTAEDGKLPAGEPMPRSIAMSTSEWVLLSLFPSQATAAQVALAISARADHGSGTQAAGAHGLGQNQGATRGVAMPTLAGPPSAGRVTSADSGLAFGTSVVGMVARGAGMLTRGTGMLARGAGMLARGAGILGDEAGRLTGGAMGLPREAFVDGLPGGAHEAVLGEDPRSALAARAPLAAPLTALLPDGRRPRGSRLLARSPMTTLTDSPLGSSAVQAGSEAATRRAEAPNGGPLWNHLRPAAPESLPMVSRPEQGPRAKALDLVAPFIESARAEGGAASFSRDALPIVAARAPDESTKSLVSALSAASSQSGSDRLSMADLTLISIVSAADQIAASPQGPAPEAAPPGPGGAGGKAQGVGGGRGSDADEVDRIARMALKALEKAARLRMNRGGG